VEGNDLSKGFGRKYAGGPTEGHSLPYRIFSKGQRVSHTAVVENKRLGQSLAMIKMQQEIKHAPKLKTNSEKTGYRNRELNRRPTGNAGELGAVPGNGEMPV
jgi:hypothetical protein